jgi:type IV pilus assembly protein PilE
MRRPIQRGFTLIELMVVIAILSILAAIAIPNYTKYVLRSETTEGTTALANAKIQMEQYFQDNRTYCSDNTCSPTTCPTTVQSQWPTSKFFTFSCSNIVGNTTTGIDPATCAAIGNCDTYQLTATGIATSPMAGYVYTVNQANIRSSTFSNGATAACWLASPGNTC